MTRLKNEKQIAGIRESCHLLADLYKWLIPQIQAGMSTRDIDDLCVEESYRGQHIGKAIYEEILRYAKGRRCYNVTLNVWTCNPGAMAFYEKLGLKQQKIGMEIVL
jgi:ribosomal protein S18 acetylase RimI-like enzyme